MIEVANLTFRDGFKLQKRKRVICIYHPEVLFNICHLIMLKMVLSLHMIITTIIFFVFWSIPVANLESKIKHYHDKMFAQRGARTHDPEIKSLMLYRLS